MDQLNQNNTTPNGQDPKNSPLNGNLEKQILVEVKWLKKLNTLLFISLIMLQAMLVIVFFFR